MDDDKIGKFHEYPIYQYMLWEYKLKTYKIWNFANLIESLFLDDDEETEWQHYLRASIETILRVSDVLPEEVLRIVVRAVWLNNDVLRSQKFKFR